MISVPTYRIILVFMTGFIFLTGCRTQQKVAAIRKEEVTIALALPSDMEIQMRDTDTLKHESPDTIVVNFEGRDMYIMKAVKDDRTGEMIANEELKAAVITARFRNIAERHGKVDLEFEIFIPDRIQDPDWQLRFQPELWIMEDTVALDRIYVTGPDYRRLQLRGYQQYYRFISKIINDPDRLVDMRDLEIFLRRNIPQIYMFRSDSSFVSDEEFASYCGVTQLNAIEHFTLKRKVILNERRKSRQDMMYARYVKVPIETEHIRLDTILIPGNGDIIYRYVETINTRPGLRKVEVVVDGDIYQGQNVIYDIPPTEPLTFYISSLAAFVDPAPRYVTEIRYRRAEVSASWNIDFQVNRSDIDMELAGNAGSIADIRRNIDILMDNQVFDLDSVTITAFASPEGSVTANRLISQKRGDETARYFERYVKQLKDSIIRETGLMISVNDDMTDDGMTTAGDGIPDIRFNVRSGGENWHLLDALADGDTVMTAVQKEEYKMLSSSIVSLDERERQLQRCSFYNYMKSVLYPQLRAVRFTFALHRKGMIKDTVHTSVLDTVYMNGIQAIRERDYERALSLLGPYRDFNAAIAMVSLDRNASAMEILQKLDPTPQVKYMLALLHSRKGEDAEAVRLYLEACHEDHSLSFRGNLDPEISFLINKYQLTN